MLIAHTLLQFSSYGSPAGQVISGQPNAAINPRLPSGGSTVYSAPGGATRASALTQENPFIAVNPESDDSLTAPLASDKIGLSEPGYG